MTVNEDGVRTQLIRGSQRHGRMHSELTRFIGCRRDHSALIRLPAHHHCFSLKRGIEQLFNRNEEGVHIDVEDDLHDPHCAASTRGIPAKSASTCTLCQSDPSIFATRSLPL